jgi:hypothetical protein
LKLSVSAAAIRQFVTALDCHTVAITNENIGGLCLLCKRRRFGDPAEWISEFRQSAGRGPGQTIEKRESQSEYRQIEAVRYHSHVI